MFTEWGFFSKFRLFAKEAKLSSPVYSRLFRRRFKSKQCTSQDLTWFLPRHTAAHATTYTTKHTAAQKEPDHVVSLPVSNLDNGVQRVPDISAG